MPRREAPPPFVTAPLPKELFRRGLLAPSMIAHVLVQKYRWACPSTARSRSSRSKASRSTRHHVPLRRARRRHARLHRRRGARARLQRPRSACRPTPPASASSPSRSPTADARPAARATSSSCSPTRTTSSSSTSPSTPAPRCARCSAASRATSRPTRTPSTTPSSAASAPRSRPTRTRPPPRGRLLEPRPAQVLGGRRLQARPRRSKGCGASTRCLQPNGDWPTLAPAQRKVHAAARRAAPARRLLRVGRSRVRTPREREVWSPPPSATPSGQEPPCVASSTTDGCPWTTTPPSEP